MAKRVRPIFDNALTMRMSAGSNALILTFAADNSHPDTKCDDLHNIVSKKFEELKYNVINAYPRQIITLDEAGFEHIPEDAYRALKECKGETTLIIAKHGHFHWLFSDNAHNDISEIKKLSESIKCLEERSGVRFKNIVLFSCMSACEFKSRNRVISDNRSPARILSENIPCTDIYGFNGLIWEKATTTNPLKPDEKVETSLEDNVVAFRAGKAIKASKHPHQGNGLGQTYRNGIPARSNSFSSEALFI